MIFYQWGGLPFTAQTIAVASLYEVEKPQDQDVDDVFVDHGVILWREGSGIDE